MRGRAAHGAGLALGELAGQRPGGPGDPGQAGGANSFGRLLRERGRLGAGSVLLCQLGAELFDGQGGPMALLGPGAAILKAVEALVGRARRLQRLHQGGALRGTLGELLRALLQLGGGPLQLRFPLLRGALALGEAGLQVDEGLELPMLATAAVRQVVEVAGDQCLGVGRLGCVVRHGRLRRLAVVVSYGGDARLYGLRLDHCRFGASRFIIEFGELALCLTDQRLDESRGRHLSIMTASVAAGGILCAAGTGDSGLLGQLGQATLVSAGGQRSDGLLGAATGGLLGDQVGPYPGGALGVPKALGIGGVLLGAPGQSLLLLNQHLTSLQEVVETLGLLAGRLSPGERFPRGLGPSIGQCDPVAGGFQYLGADAAKSYQVRGGARHRRLQGLGRCLGRGGVGLLMLRAAGVIHGQRQRLLGPPGRGLLRRVIR